MSKAQSPIVNLAQWLETGPGQYVQRWEQNCFDKMVADPAMIDMATKRALEIDPAPGAVVQGYSDAIVKTPPDVVEKAAAAFKG